jgi:hypothetical protein
LRIAYEPIIDALPGKYDFTSAMLSVAKQFISFCCYAKIKQRNTAPKITRFMNREGWVWRVVDKSGTSVLLRAMKGLWRYPARFVEPNYIDASNLPQKPA